MTNSDAIFILSHIEAHGAADEARRLAIDALKVVEGIKEIINISNFAIQEDVLKYKMICEVFERMDEAEK